MYELITRMRGNFLVEKILLGREEMQQKPHIFLKHEVLKIFFIKLSK